MEMVLLLLIELLLIEIQIQCKLRMSPEFSQVTGMALARCILGKLLRGSLPLLSPAFRRSHFCRQVLQRPREILTVKGGTVGENVVR